MDDAYIQQTNKRRSCAVLEYDGTHFEVEYYDADGNTIDVFSTPADIIELVSEYGNGGMQNMEFYKENPTDKVWWVDDPDNVGTIRFSFDKKKIYYLYRDYDKLKGEEKEIFDKENPFWAAFFKGKE